MADATQKLAVANAFIDASTPPIQTVNLAMALGIRVFHAEMEDFISGKIQRDALYGGTSGYAIFVNKGHHVNRRRFTTAHEIAHFIYHEHLIGDGVVDDALYRSGLSSREEAQANRLAADILMPWKHLNPALQANISNDGTPNAYALSRLFQVSEQAMKIRLNMPT